MVHNCQYAAQCVQVPNLPLILCIVAWVGIKSTLVAFLRPGTCTDCWSQWGVSQALLCPQIDHANLSSGYQHTFAHSFQDFARFNVALASVTCWKHANNVVALTEEASSGCVNFSCQKLGLVGDKTLGSDESRLQYWPVIKICSQLSRSTARAPVAEVRQTKGPGWPPGRPLQRSWRQEVPK